MKLYIHGMSGSPTDHAITAGAVGTATASYFNAIPWSNVAAFLSVCWLTLQIGLFAVNLVRSYWGKPPISITSKPPK